MFFGRIASGKSIKKESESLLRQNPDRLGVQKIFKDGVMGAAILSRGKMHFARASMNL
jgi:hypothetical protein